MQTEGSIREAERNLKKGQIESEKQFWEVVRNRKLVIEIDGGIH